MGPGDRVAPFSPGDPDHDRSQDNPRDYASARGARDEVIALPAALQQAQALTTLGDRPLVVVTAGSGQQAGWLTAQDQMPRLSTTSVHRVIAEATHNSLITGADAETSTQAIMDVVESIRAGTALQ